jgi:hypothetical protein
VTASILFSLIFDTFGIPYKINASPEHVYLVANPGEKSILVETTNPTFENMVFNGEFKQQYVNYLKESKQISESEYNNMSVEEIFELKFKEVKESEYNNLFGFQYYNKAVQEAQDDHIDDAYVLCQKAYFFYRENQVKLLLLQLTLTEMEICKFNRVEDMDYLVQLSRFENVSDEIISQYFGYILSKKLDYVESDDFCDSLYHQFITKSKDPDLNKEIGFTFNLMMYKNYYNTRKGEKYIINAINLKDNHKDANKLFTYMMMNKLDKIYNNEQRLDTINAYEKKYTYPFFKPVLKDYKCIVYLQTARESFDKNNVKEGEAYLKLFEENYESPSESIIFDLVEKEIVSAYRKAATIYYNQKNTIKMKESLERGLKYVPDSELLKNFSNDIILFERIIIE